MTRTAMLATTIRNAHPAAVFLAAALLWAALLAVIAAVRYGGDARAFLCLGDRMRHPAALAGIPRNSAYGYDGQYYATLALDPLLHSSDTVASLDAPLYRAGRVGVPLAAWVLGLGHPAAALLSYQLLCWGGCLLAVYLAALWLRDEQRSPLWALLIAAFAGLATSMFRSTPDGAAVALVLLALLLDRRGRPAGAIAALAAATLARETSVLAAFAVAFAAARQRRWGRAAASVAVPLAVYGVWHLYLRLHLAAAHTDRGTSALGIPFVWVPAKLAQLLAGGFWSNRMELLGMVALAASLFAVAVIAARFPRWTAAAAAFVAFGGLALLLGIAVYVEVYAHARVLLALPVLALLLAAGESRRAPRTALLTAVALATLTGVVVVRGELRAALAARSAADAAVLPAAGGLAPAPPAKVVAPPTPTPTPPPPPPLYVLPVARAAGFLGAQWRTELAIANPTAAETAVTFDLLAAGQDNREPRRTTVTLAPGESRAIADALGELFGASGSAALRATRQDGGVTVRSRTFDSAAKAPRGRLLAGIDAGTAFGPGRPARLDGLSHDPAAATRKRTNLGVLNVTGAAVEIVIAVTDEAGAAIGSHRLPVPPFGFVQVDDVFAVVGATAPADGSARVSTPTPGGAFLTYASVVRRDPPSVTYVWPAEGAAAAPPATPAAPSSATAPPAGGSAPPSPR
jgi:hypothetical protein